MIMAKYGTNKSRTYIRRNEFEKLMKDRCKEQKYSKLSNLRINDEELNSFLFNALDQDMSGAIDRGELSRNLKLLKKKTNDSFEELIKEQANALDNIPVFTS